MNRRGSPDQGPSSDTYLKRMFEMGEEGYRVRAKYGIPGGIHFDPKNRYWTDLPPNVPLAEVPYAAITLVQRSMREVLPIGFAAEIPVMERTRFYLLGYGKEALSVGDWQTALSVLDATTEGGLLNNPASALIMRPVIDFMQVLYSRYEQIK